MANIPRASKAIKNDFFRFIFNSSSFAVIGLDCQGVIVSWNQAAENWYGVAAEKMLGRHVATIFPDAVGELLENAITRGVTKQQVSEFEIEQRPGQDSPQTYSVVITPVVDDQGGIQGLAGWVRNITNRKKLQHQLLQAEKMASLGTLASGVAHHFNNIIAGVATFVDYALHNENPQASRRALQMTAEAANRISQITSSLLTFAEKDMRQFDLSDLTEVILTFSNLVEKPLLGKNIRLNLHLEPVSVYEVPGSRFHQVLGNLLDNAECAMPEGGDLTIKLYRENKEIILIFSDTGTGIAPRDLPHIFEPFYTTKGVAAGGNQFCSGLGLSVVHGVIHELGGSIEVKSELGKGTTFILHLPVSASG